MASPFIQSAFTTGEISPSLFGRVDFQKWHLAASTMRNTFVSYRGGAYSRAGTRFSGFSKQTGRAYPPRLVTFQFSINQGLALEFGNFYMRVLSNGSFVTEAALPITGAIRANPAQLTVAAEGATAATPNNGAVASSYAPGDSITLAGGTFSQPAVLSVTNTTLHSLLTDHIGSGYAINDTITLAGGTPTTAAVMKVLSLSNATFATGNIAFSINPSDSDTITLNGVTWTFVNAITGGNQTGIAGTLQDTLAVLAAQLNASTNASLTVATYGATPSTLTIAYDTPGVGGNAYALAASAAAPSAGTLTGGGVATGVGSFSIQTAGVYTANAAGGAFSQAATSGGGTGATFRFGIFAPNAVTVSTNGVYAAPPANPATQASTSGSGRGATFTVTYAPEPPFVNGDWVFVQGVAGMTQLNGQTYVVSGIAGSTFNLTDVYGNTINSTAFSAYAGGGTASKIFTLATPYSEVDLDYLKWTQSADVMSICCWNQLTGTTYAPQELRRFADDNWTINPPNFAATISPPGVTSGNTTSAGSTDYQYVITAVNPADGSESIASPIADIPNSVNIAVTQGTITVVWSQVPSASVYNIYKAPPNSAGSVPVGSLFGYAGTSYGNRFTDANITPDLTQVPPQHRNPFAPGQIVSAPILVGGSGYTTATATITTATGDSAVLLPVIVNGSVAALIVDDAGENYEPGDTVTLTGDGTGASAALTIGPQTGTYPSVPGYFQERRVYAATPNNPDTYFMSQPGAFSNFDARVPTVDSDAITGSPWSVEVNGIQFMISMPGGLVVLTGLSAWQLTGVGGSSLNPQPITPANQQAQPQAYNGCSSTVGPIKIDYDIIYLQAKGSIFRDLSYNFFTNIYTGQDLTELSSHLFTGFTIRQSAWCEEPYKIMWAIRNDGVLLSLTYLKPQEVQGWARHDTNGLFVSLCSVTEPPVDALYLATQRFLPSGNAYLIERMDDRLWQQAEDCWCVDAGLELAQPTPVAIIGATSATGLGALVGITDLVGGQNYSNLATATIVDDNGQGPGTGAIIALTVVGGAITGMAFSAAGSGYAFPAIVINDPSGQGSGASAEAVLSNAATFGVSVPVFSPGNVGSVIRMGGGIAVITAYVDAQKVTAEILSPITAVLPTGTVIPQAPGNWTMTAPVSTFTGLQHLAGAIVTGLADGNIIPPTVVSPSGSITLAKPASSVVVGVGFQAQLQSVYFDGMPQGARKKIATVTVRMENSRGIKVGADQPDGSALSPIRVAPPWNNLSVVPDMAQMPYNALCQPLYTGDSDANPVKGGYQKPAQICVQQDNPLPMQILAFLPTIAGGDVAEPGPASRQQGSGRGRASA
jgi:hypothetical protein